MSPEYGEADSKLSVQINAHIISAQNNDEVAYKACRNPLPLSIELLVRRCSKLYGADPGHADRGKVKLNTAPPPGLGLSSILP